MDSINPDTNPQPSSQPPQNQYGPPPGQVYGASNPPQPAGPPPQPHNYEPSDSKTKKITIILGGLIGVFIILAAVVFLTSGSDNSQQTPSEESAPANLFKEPSALELENLNNSVNDDITNLSADSDFPSEKLSDDSLDL
ncbi:hypothetical protein KY385_03740 [Candidatus Parcubacteria bacterium]|nr:hypothetical protein [Candidatus Parcubacteria bacterium]